jgi:catechol 2,3-dioxygenase-like lactoylglutathione lyase family enzyme
MIDHFRIDCEDLDASKRFYDTVLATLGLGRVIDTDTVVSYGRDGRFGFLISSMQNIPPNRPAHFAFSAPDVETVDAFHAAATGLGAETLHEPRLWPEYHPHYYAVFVRDPDGNNVEAVCHTAAPA